MPSTISLRRVESLEKIYNDILNSTEVKKGVTVGGALVTFPNKERTICELSATYINKPGRFSKEQRVIVTLTLNKSDGQTYSGDIDDSIFHVVSEDKGGLKEIWNGRLQEATGKFGDIVQSYIEAILALNSKLSA